MASGNGKAKAKAKAKISKANAASGGRGSGGDSSDDRAASPADDPPASPGGTTLSGPWTWPPPASDANPIGAHRPLNEHVNVASMHASLLYKLACLYKFEFILMC